MSRTMPSTSVAASLVLLALSSVAGAQTQLYFAEYEFNAARVRSMGLDGSNPQTLFALPSNEWLPVGMSFDPPTQRFFIADMASPENIVRVNLDGSGFTSLVTATGSTRAPRFDGAGKMYFTSGNQIWRSNVDGSSPQVLFTAVQPYPLSGVAVDGTNGHVYFGGDHVIRRMNLDGSNVLTVVRGVSSVRDIELDIAGGYIYWLDADTLSDFVGRVRLDDTEFTVLVDSSPGVVQSGGLISLLVDRIGGKLYFADDLHDRVERTELNGLGRTTIYSIASGPSPSALALSTGPQPQALADCNANGVGDALDIANAVSSDCNANGVPDECELDPCPSFTFLVDQGSDPVPPSLTLGGPGPSSNQQFEIFAPIDVPAGGWNVGEIHVDGFTVNYADGSGFTATLFPDNGANFADESAPIASSSCQFRFNTATVNWIRRPFQVALPAGRHWLRLRSNQTGVYFAAANIGTSGLPAVSRRGDGQLFTGSPLALRVTEGCPAPQTYCTAKLSSSGCLPAISASGAPTPTGSFVVSVAQVEGQRAGLVFRGFNGPLSAPFQGGFLCVAPPLVRFPAQNSGGAAGTCGGAFSYPLSAFIAASPAGSSFWMQAWFRDPQSASTTGLSNGIAFTTCP
jgi:hypothetical protein